MLKKLTRHYLSPLRGVLRGAMSRLTWPWFIFLSVLHAARANEYIDQRRLTRTLYLQISVQRGVTSFQITGTGVLLLFTCEQVLKIPLGPLSAQSLSKNLENHTLLKATPLAGYVDYPLNHVNGVYHMSLLRKVLLGNEALDMILRDFHRLSKGPLSAEVVRARVSTGMQLLEHYLGEAVDFPEGVKFESSAMHGDLTPANVMTDAAGRLMLIDLDRFELDGIDGLDRVHFLVTCESLAQCRPFFECLPMLCERGYPAAWLIVYLLYRLSVEHVDGVVLEKHYYLGAAAAYKLLLK